jgi:hypothetical protein
MRLMRTSCCLCVYVSPLNARKVGIVYPEQTTVIRKRRSKHVTAATNTYPKT